MKSNKMKKMKKRILAMVLCATMIMNTGVAAFAEDVATVSLEDAHVHVAECYEKKVTDQLSCTKAEVSETEAHVHSDECYEVTTIQELTCTEAETAGHSHDDSCVETTEVLSCGKDEHTHDDSCAETAEVLKCEVSEHTHDEGCYTTDTKNVCGQEEVEGHTHGEGCYTTTESKTQICALEEVEAHVHSDDCYVWEETLVCTITEVTPAQLEEIEEVQEPTEELLVEEEPTEVNIQNSDETGITVSVESTSDVLAEDTKVVVETIEIDETMENALVEAAGELEVLGYVAYDISLKNADDTNVVLGENTVNVAIDFAEMIPEGIEAEKVTDVVLVHITSDERENVVAETVGKVEVTEDKKATEVEFETSSFSPYAVTWLGEHEEEIEPITYIWEDENVTVEVIEAVEGAIPEGSKLSVTPIVSGDEYQEVETQLQEKAENEEYEIAGFLAYDIKFVNEEGNEVEPNGDVRVTINYKKATLPEAVNAEEVAEFDVTVMHLEEDAEGEVKEVVDMVAEENIEAEVKTTKNAEVEKAEFVTSSFSAFVITWTNLGKTLSVKIVDAYGSEITVDGATDLDISVNDGEVSLTKDDHPDEISSVITAKGREYTFLKAVIAKNSASAIRIAAEITGVRYSANKAQYCQDGTWKDIAKNYGVYLVYVDHSTFRITWTDINKTIPVNIVNVYADEMAVDGTPGLEISIGSGEVDLTNVDDTSKIPNVVTENGKKYTFLKAIVASKGAVPETIRTNEAITGIRFSGTNAQYCQDGTWKNIGNNVVRLIYVDYELVDAERNLITTEEYEKMLQEMENQLNSTENGNLPITNWERSDSQTTVRNRASEAEDWTWSSVAGALELNIKDESRVWDGSRLIDGEVEHYYDYLATNMVTAYKGELYDSASWKKSATISNKQPLTAQMYRFRGQFDIGTGDPNDYTYTLKPVTGGEQIFINDDMFVFVYPTNVELNDNNFMDYLAFWTGTVNQEGNDWDFHGRYGTAAEKLDPAEQEERVLTKITDGWHLKAISDNAGSIIQSIYNEHVQNGTEAPTKYYVDIITDDYFGGGGMYRLKLEQELVEKVEVKFVKMDSLTGEPVKGAKFAFDLKKEGGKYLGVHYTATSNDNGEVILKLIPGTYILTESSAPNNFAKDPGEWKIVVEEDGDYTITRNNVELEKVADGKYAGWYSITNERIARDVEVLKVNEAGNALAGAEFTLYSDANCETAVGEPVETNKDGIALFESLEFGTYYLKETKAPKNYQKDDQKWIVTVSAENYTITDAEGNEVTEIVNIPALGDLIISKSLAVFNQTLGGATFVFQVEAVRDGVSIYNDVVSMTFNTPGEQEIEIKDIPAGAEVTVTEVYSGASYEITLDSAMQKKVTIEAGKDNEVSFENDYVDGRINSGSAVVNAFEKDETGWKHLPTTDQIALPSKFVMNTEETLPNDDDELNDD